MVCEGGVWCLKGKYVQGGEREGVRVCVVYVGHVFFHTSNVFLAHTCEMSQGCHVHTLNAYSTTTAYTQLPTI